MTYRLLTFALILAFGFALSRPGGEIALADHHSSKNTAPPAADAPPHNVAPEGWTSLFNGKDTEGWEVKSGYATYEVKGGAITGTTAKGSGNSFLCTTKIFKDFELKFDVFLHDDKLNSGCQVRSKIVRPGGKYGGRIGGPQVEISANRQAGFIFGEAGLGGWWTQDPKEKRHDHFKKGQWNTYHVVAKGNTITTLINGNLIAETNHPEKYKDEFQEGVIGLQVHSVKDDPKWQVSWRNIYIKPLD